MVQQTGMNSPPGSTPPAGEVHIEDDRARAGSTPHIVRYVLLISLTLAIVALSTIWIMGALTGPDSTGGTTGGFSDTEQAAHEAQ